MHLANQQSGQMIQHVKFSPVSSSISNVGTTVTYSINPTNTINAFNQNFATTGNFTNFQQSGLQTGWNTMLTNTYQPIVTASQFNQPISGGFFGYPQMQQFGRQITGLMVQPSIDISETSSDVVITAYVPNLPINDMTLSCTENSVTISASAWTGNQSLVVNRTVALPTSIRAEAIDAGLQSGVLEIRCPKAEKAVRRRTTVSPDVNQQR